MSCLQPYTRPFARILMLACLLGPPVSAPVFAYDLVDLGKDVSPKDINNAGIVVGSRRAADYSNHAFVYDSGSGQLSDLDATAAYAVNDAGTIVGTTLTGAFILEGGNLRTWDEQGAYGISESGLVSGNQAGDNPYRTTSIPYNPAVYTGNKWEVMDIAQVYPRGTRQGVYADIYLLDDVNDAGYSVGSRRRYGLVGSSAILIQPPYGDVKDAADVIYLSTPAGGAASAINDANVIVGTTGNSSAGDYASAFIYDNGQLTVLPPLPGGLRSSAADINDDNIVVGSSETGGLKHAFVWDVASGMQDLNDVAGDAQWVLMSATAINERGDIVGTGQLNGESHGFVLLADAPPPPPSENLAPVAVVSSDTTRVKVGQAVKFYGSDSDDPDGDQLSFQWDFGDGTQSAATDPEHAFDAVGTYVVVLTVSDGHLEDSATLEIRVRGKRR